MRFGCLFQKKTITKSFTFLPFCYPVFLYSLLSSELCVRLLYILYPIFIDGWMVGWMNGWLDGWMVGRIYFSAEVYGMYTDYRL